MICVLADKIRIHDSWKTRLLSEFSQPYFSDLKNFLLTEKQQYIVYPPSSQIFAAFDNTPFEMVKVVILGQDPYHGQGQAHGLCFSVPKGIDKPPSLVNIFKELHADLSVEIPATGDLTSWASQGVLLINATLTVRQNQAGSHQKKGWERFTDSVINKLSTDKEHLVFLLWGNYARAKKNLIDSSKHLILEAAHPSPLSAYNGFFGCKHFSTTNNWLKEHHLQEIQWGL